MVASEQHLYQTIVLPRKLATGGIHDYFFCYCPLVGILFEVLRIISCFQQHVKCSLDSMVVCDTWSLKSDRSNMKRVDILQYSDIHKY